jgi:DNA-binding PadR family transcriptional regulator
MTSRQRQILEVLAAATGEMYGLDIVAAGAASRASLYVELARLEDHGWIESHEEENPLSGVTFVRRLYRITTAGAAQLLPAAKVVP